MRVVCISFEEGIDVRLKFVALGAFTASQLGCATYGTVVVRSNPPEANVYMFDLKTGQNALLGKTPMTFSKKVAADKSADVIQLRIEKDGFESKYASVATLGKQTTYIDIRMSSAISANADLRKAFEVNRQLIMEANRLAASRRFSEALARVEKVLEVDPKNDEAHAAKGSLMYLMKDYEGAQVAWKKALELNPSNDAVRASLVDLNIGLDSPNRSPSSQGAP